MVRCRIVVASFLVNVLLAGSVALAQDEEAPPAAEPSAAGQPENMEATQQARRHFMAGAEHFRAHRYREAIQSFELAAGLVPSADLWFNIARSYEELSEYEEAITLYQRYLRDRVDPPDRGQVEQLIERLREQAATQRASASTRPTTGVLRLRANHDGSEVQLDGSSVDAAPWAGPREVDPGRHQLSVLRDGYIPFHSEVSVEAGVTTAAYADLLPETRYRSIQPDPIFAWMIWGLAAASFGVTIGLGVEAASLQATDLPEARTFAAYSDVFLGATIGLGVLGIIIWFVESSSVGTERITAEGAGATDLHGE